MSSIGKIALDLSINNKGFTKQINNIKQTTTKSFGSMSVAVGNIVSNMVQKAALSLGNFVKDSIEKGSTLSELQNVVDSVFTTMSDKVESFAQNALEAYGLTETQAKKMMGTFGAMSKSFGFSEAQALDMAAAITGLAGDVASFYNLSHEEAYTKLKSIFTGETESLKELGVVMTQTALDEFALANGFGKTTANMSEQEKVALRLAFVQDKLSTASGDFIKTQDQWANQTRILTGQFESFKAAMGQGFINVLTPVVQMLNVLMAKLVQVANAFKSFTEMIMGKGNNSGAGKAMTDVAKAADNAATATGGIEDAAAGAASSAKQAKKALMGFDEINKLQKTDASGGSGSGMVDEFDFSAFESQGEAINEVIENAKSRIKELIKLLVEGFKEGIGDDFYASIDRIKEHAKSIGETFKEIYSDPEVVNGFNNMLNSMATGYGKYVGGLFSVGVSIGEMITGGIDYGLSQSKKFVKDRLVGITGEVGQAFESMGEVGKSVASIFEVFRGDNAKKIVGDFFSIFIDTSLGIIELSMKIGNDILTCISKPLIDNQDKLKVLIENILEPVSRVTSVLSNSVRESFEKVFEVYETKIRPAFQGIADGLSSVFSTYIDAYNKNMAPILDKLASKISEVWTNSVQPAIDKTISMIGKLMELISIIWQNVLVPFINWVTKNIMPVIAPITDALVQAITIAFGLISDVIGGMMGALEGTIEFLIGVFTLDWKRAWGGIKMWFEESMSGILSIFTNTWELIVTLVTGIVNAIKEKIELAFNTIKLVTETIWGSIKNLIANEVTAAKSLATTGFNLMKSSITNILNAIKNTFTNVFNGIWNFMKGIINTILGGVEGMVNGVIKGLNNMIYALNSLSFEVPDWVPLIGGGKFGFGLQSLSTVNLPRLAEGGYVRANQPQPVIVGDNKTQGEIIAPENKMLQVVIQALESFFGKLMDAGYSSTSERDMGDIVIPIYLDGSMLDEVIVTAQQRRVIRSGGR